MKFSEIETNPNEFQIHVIWENIKASARLLV